MGVELRSAARRHPHPGSPGTAGVLRRHGRQPRRSPHRDVVRGRQPARRARRSGFCDVANVATSFPDFPGTAAGRRPRTCAGAVTDAACGPDHHHRRPQRLGQGHDCAPGRRPARLAPARQRRAVPAGRAGRPAARRWPPTTRPGTRDVAAAAGCQIRPGPRRRRADLAGRRGSQPAPSGPSRRARAPRGWRPCRPSGRRCWSASAPLPSPPGWSPTAGTWARWFSLPPRSRSS